jgi:hypothetical protein
MLRYDEFGFIEEWEEEPSPPDASLEPSEPHVPMRERFPEAGADYMGGSSDGWEYRTAFTGSRLSYAYEMVKQFLAEEGYADVPLPESTEDLKLFKKPRHPQLQLFAERGYVHNPVKILFPSDPKLRNTLFLCIYNERAPGHLLRFHGLA